MPPPESSHTLAHSEGEGQESGAAEKPRVIRVTPLAYLGVFLLAMSVFLAIVGSPAALCWLAVVPVGVAVWIVRSRTTITSEGLWLRSVWRTRHIGWQEARGVRLPRHGLLRLRLADETEVRLPAVTYERLPDLIAAAGGRIPNPYRPVADE